MKRSDLRKMRDIDYRGNSPRQEAVEVTDEEFDELVIERLRDARDRSDVRSLMLTAAALKVLLPTCEHGETSPHIAAQKGMAQMMWTCPGPRDESL